MEPLQPEDPEQLGRYRLEARLGAGGMGRVYLGSTPEGRRAAVKMIRHDLAGDTGFRHRFRREVSAALSVAGLFTARVLDADPDGDPPWLATEFVEGPALRDAVLAHGPLPADQLLPLARGLAQALGAVHAAGLVHRDLKPANVLLSPTGPKVIDFGIAWSAGGTQLTGTGQAVGTPEYMAPEQIAGTGGGPAIDVFALGATLVFAATGRGPFAADQPAAVLYRILHLEPDLTGVPAGLRDLVRACLDKDPARRPTAQQIAVGPAGAGLGWAATPAGSDPRATATMPTPPPARSGAPEPTWPGGPPRRRWPLVAVSAAVAAVLVALVVLLVVRPGGSPEPGPDPVAAPTSAPVADPNSPQVRYVDRLCASGELLITLGDSTVVPPATGDPAQARSDFLAASDRVIAVVDAALADFTVLRDEAPTAEIGVAFGQVVEEFTSARTAFAGGRGTVEAADPLTVPAYREGVGQFTDGVRNLALAATLVQGVTLPADYTDASPAAPNCAD